MMIAILIVTIITFLALGAVTWLARTYVKGIVIILRDDMTFHKTKVIQFLNNQAKKSNIDVPDVEIRSDAQLAREEVEKYRAEMEAGKR